GLRPVLCAGGEGGGLNCPNCQSDKTQATHRCSGANWGTARVMLSRELPQCDSATSNHLTVGQTGFDLDLTISSSGSGSGSPIRTLKSNESEVLRKRGTRGKSAQYPQDFEVIWAGTGTGHKFAAWK